MPRRKSMKIAPAIVDLQFQIPAGGGADTDSRSYIDTAKELSKINRRLYSQSRMYGYQGLTFIWKVDNSAADIDRLELSVRTAGNTWIVHNAHVKGHAMWKEMNQLVLADNPSIKPKWYDYKVRLSTEMLSDRILSVKDGYGVDVAGGEWQTFTYVMPQHDVDPATGEPLAADEFTACLIGDDGATIKSLVKAYQESRSTVQPLDPNVPAAMSTSFFNLLTDSGSQEPELADVLEDSNDAPPYDVDNYPGGDTNGNAPNTVAYGAISTSEVDGRLGGFVAPCGLLELEIKGYSAALISELNPTGEVSTANMPAVDILLHVAPGTYKGVAAIPMGQ